jgi:hypothetical protein
MKQFRGLNNYEQLVAMSKSYRLRKDQVFRAMCGTGAEGHRLRVVEAGDTHDLQRVAVDYVEG